MDKAVGCLLLSEGAEVVFLVGYIAEDGDELWLGVRGIALSVHGGSGGVGFVEFGGGLSQ